MTIICLFLSYKISTKVRMEATTGNCRSSSTTVYNDLDLVTRFKVKDSRNWSVVIEIHVVV